MVALEIELGVDSQGMKRVIGFIQRRTLRTACAGRERLSYNFSGDMKNVRVVSGVSLRVRRPPRIALFPMRRENIPQEWHSLRWARF